MAMFMVLPDRRGTVSFMRVSGAKENIRVFLEMFSTPVWDVVTFEDMLLGQHFWGPPNPSPCWLWKLFRVFLIGLSNC